MTAWPIFWWVTLISDPSLYRAIAEVETDNRPHIVSRARGGRFCGVTQAQAVSEADCVALRDRDLAVLRTQGELFEWARICSRMGKANIRCVLRGYCCGSASARGGGGHRYAERVLAHWAGQS